MHPTKKFVRRHQHDLTSAPVRTPANLVSHHSQDIPEQQSDLKTVLHSEFLAKIVLSSSTCQVVLHLLPLVLFCQRGCLSFCPLRAGFLRCHRQMRQHVEPPPAISSIPRFLGTSPAPRPTRALFLSRTRSVSAILSLYAFILAFPVKVLSMIVLILSRHSSLCGFVAFPCNASAAHPGSLPCVRELQCPQTRRKIFWAELLVPFQQQSLAMVVPLLLCQL